MRIRAAAPADHRILAQMRYDFRAELAAPTETRDEFIERMIEWLGHHFPGAKPSDRDGGTATSWQGWVAFGEGADHPIGHVFVHFVEKLPNPIPEPELIGYVTNLYVVPTARRRGVGAALLARATGEARSRGCDTVVLWPSPDSVSLYERHGYRRPARVMELGLGGSRTDPCGRAVPGS